MSFPDSPFEHPRLPEQDAPPVEAVVAYQERPLQLPAWKGLLTECLPMLGS
jgi:hypothetical protein